MNSKSLSTKLSVKIFFSVVCVLVVFIALTTISTQRFIQLKTEKDIQVLLKSIDDNYEVFDKAARADVDRIGRYLRSMTVNQLSVDPQKRQKIGERELPQLSFNGTPVDPAFAILDSFKAEADVTSSFFVRDGDDFYRYATSVKKENGQRAVGTPLGNKHPAHALMMDGKTFFGNAVVFGRLYMVSYTPMIDSSGKVFGAVSVGIDISKSFTLFKEKVRGMTLGKTGFFFAISEKDKQLVIHPTKEGQKLEEVLDADGRDVLKLAFESKEGVIRGAWKDLLQDEKSAVDKLWVVRYLPGAKWTLIGQVNSAELVNEVHQTIIQLSAFAVILLILATLLMKLFIKRNVIRPLNDAINAAEQLAQGNLSYRLKSESNDELGSMVKAMNGIGEGLSRVVDEVRDGSVTLQQATEEIKQGNANLSQRTEAQAGRIEETAGSMDELTATVTNNAESTRNATQFVAHVSQVATEGGALVEQVVATMAEIRESSNKIQAITAVINGIAFQTNILALNAAVEAARAGVEGRGFAVVASEVRNLAQSASSAAKDIQELIAESVERVAIGDGLASQAGNTMNQIVDDIKKISVIVNDISTASHQQGSGINQINHSIAELEEFTQRNSGLVEEAAAAAESIHQEAIKLNHYMDRFKILEISNQHLKTVPDSTQTWEHTAATEEGTDRLRSQNSNME